MRIIQLILFPEDSNSNSQKKIVLREGDNYIGSSPQCDVTIDDPGLSEFHTKIIVSQNEELSIEDLGGKLGTFRQSAHKPMQRLTPNREYELIEKQNFFVGKHKGVVVFIEEKENGNGTRTEISEARKGEMRQGVARREEMNLTQTIIDNAKSTPRGEMIDEVRSGKANEKSERHQQNNDRLQAGERAHREENNGDGGNGGDSRVNRASDLNSNRSRGISDYSISIDSSDNKKTKEYGSDNFDTKRDGNGNGHSKNNSNNNSKIKGDSDNNSKTKGDSSKNSNHGSFTDTSNSGGYHQQGQRDSDRGSNAVDDLGITNTKPSVNGTNSEGLSYASLHQSDNSKDRSDDHTSRGNNSTGSSKSKDLEMKESSNGKFPVGFHASETVVLSNTASNSSKSSQLNNSNNGNSNNSNKSNSSHTKSQNLVNTGTSNIPPADSLVKPSITVASPSDKTQKGFQAFNSSKPVSHIFKAKGNLLKAEVELQSSPLKSPQQLSMSPTLLNEATKIMSISPASSNDVASAKYKFHPINLSNFEGNDFNQGLQTKRSKELLIQDLGIINQENPPDRMQEELPLHNKSNLHWTSPSHDPVYHDDKLDLNPRNQIWLSEPSSNKESSTKKPGSTDRMQTESSPRPLDQLKSANLLADPSDKMQTENSPCPVYQSETMEIQPTSNNQFRAHSHADPQPLLKITDENALQHGLAENLNRFLPGKFSPVSKTAANNSTKGSSALSPHMIEDNKRSLTHHSTSGHTDYLSSSHPLTSHSLPSDRHSPSKEHSPITALPIRALQLMEIESEKPSSTGKPLSTHSNNTPRFDMKTDEDIKTEEISPTISDQKNKLQRSRFLYEDEFNAALTNENSNSSKWPKFPSEFDKKSPKEVDHSEQDRFELHPTKKMKLLDDEGKISEFPVGNMDSEEKKKRSSRMSREAANLSLGEDLKIAKRNSHQVLFTGFNKTPEFAKMKKDLAGLGARVINDPEKAFNILLMGEFKRTINFLAAINKGVDIISVQWVHDSLRAKQLLPIDKYQFYDANVEKLYKFSLKESMQKARKNKTGILNGYKVWIDESVLPSFEEIKRLAVSAGGAMMNKKPGRKDDHKEKEKGLVFVKNDDYWAVAHFIDAGWRVYSAEVLFDGVLRQKLDLENDDYVLGEPF